MRGGLALCAFALAACTAQTPPSDCVKDGDRGNELQVGEFCTPGGGECQDNGFGGHAVICTVDFVSDADLWMCTKPCDTDADCGSATVCQGDPADPDSSKGCVPAACASAAPDAGTPVDGGS